MSFDEEGFAYHVSLTDPREPEVGTREAFVIVKVQVPLNDPSHPALIYDRGRTFRSMVDSTLVMNHMGGRKKAFFYAQLHDGQVTLADEAPDQSW